MPRFGGPSVSIAGFVIALALCLVGVANTPTYAGGKFALVIGNGEYKRAGRLPNPTKDAKLLAEVLSPLGFEVMLMTDLDEDEMGEALDLLDEKVDDLDVALVFFAGHGMQIDGRNYLLPVDAKLRTESAVEREAISLQSVVDIMERAKTSLIFLDACRDNPLAEALAEKSMSSGRGARVIQGLATMRTAGDMLIGYATLPNSVAYDGEVSNSPYSRALARHLATPDVEISVLMKRVTRDVLDETGGKQRPQQMSQMQTEFYFSKTGDETIAEEVTTLFAAYPEFAKTGDEIALFADVPLWCRPSFFDIAPSNKITPIPIRYFKTYSLGEERIRFEISPGSRFGLIVQEHDERGRHQIGFFCQTEKALNTEGKKRLLGRLVSKVRAGVTSDALGQEYENVRFHFAPYVIE